MPRLIALLLVLANVGYFAWSQNWLRDFGFAPARQGEPERIARQINPEALRIVKDAGDAGAPAPPASSSSEPASGPNAAAAASPAATAPPANAAASATAFPAESASAATSAPSASTE